MLRDLYKIRISGITEVDDLWADSFLNSLVPTLPDKHLNEEQKKIKGIDTLRMNSDGKEELTF